MLLSSTFYSYTLFQVILCVLDFCTPISLSIEVFCLKTVNECGIHMKINVFYFSWPSVIFLEDTILSKGHQVFFQNLFCLINIEAANSKDMDRFTMIKIIINNTELLRCS